MTYKKSTKLRICSKYAIKALQRYTNKTLKIGDVFTVKLDNGKWCSSYHINEIEQLKTGWNPTFIDDEKNFKLAKITNWRAEL